MTRARDLADLGNNAATLEKQGLTLINTTSIGSTVSSVSLPANTFTSTYDSYRVIIDFTNTTAASTSLNVTFRLRNGTTDASGSNYSWVGTNAVPSGLAAYSDSGVAQQYVGRILSATPTRYQCEILISGIAKAQETKYWWTFIGMDGGTNNTGWGGGFHTVATAYDSMTILTSTGTISGGRISVYGINQ